MQKTQRKQHLKLSRGYWKLLGSATNHNTVSTVSSQKYASLDHLQQIESLVMHKCVAVSLLDYKSRGNAFKTPIRVRIHDRTGDLSADQFTEYEIQHWNGGDVGQCSAFRIEKCGSGKRANCYINFQCRLPNVRWHWYDNDSSRYKPYTMGMDVERQMECCFQGCLRSNFCQNEYFNCALLTELKRAYVEQFGDRHKLKTFMMRFGYDIHPVSGDCNRWRILTAERVTVSDNAFPRSIQRIDSGKGGINDLCGDAMDRFSLRMKAVYDLNERRMVAAFIDDMDTDTECEGQSDVPERGNRHFDDI